MGLDIAQALASSDQPEAIFAAVAHRVQAEIGARLFTLTTLDLAGGCARRCYSNMPEAYPVSGEKPITPNAWTKTVIDRHKIFRADTIAQIAEVFPDHKLIQSLGCESCVNIPVIVRGRLLGTMNCLHEAHYYAAVSEDRLIGLSVYGALAFMMQS